MYERFPEYANAIRAAFAAGDAQPVTVSLLVKRTKMKKDVVVRVLAQMRQEGSVGVCPSADDQDEPAYFLTDAGGIV